MKRRSLVALVAAAVLGVVGLVALSAVLYLTRTESGRDRIRGLVQSFAKGKVKNGSVYIGRLSGSFFSGLTIDTLAVRDVRGDLVLSTGRVTVSYNPRDLVDSRIYIRRAEVEHPFVHLVQHGNGTWNYKELIPPSTSPALPKDVNARNIGDYVVIDSAALRDGTFLLTMPWRPDESLRGRARDSVVRAHLSNPAKAVSTTYDGYGRLYAWRNIRGLASHIRIADPDSDKFGQEFKVATLSVDEFEPTFKFRNFTGEARKQGDSVFFKVPHFEMPASRGHGQGKVWWGDGPVHYAITVQGEEVALDDVNWVYPYLPRTGGGSLQLVIANDPKNAQIVDFRLQKVDVRTTESHLTGDMWFGIGAPVLLVRNVAIKADPMDFDFLRTLNGKDFPIDWRGQLFGTVKARGGPLTNFYVDDARGSYVDKHVRGATSRFAAKGELDILYPALTAFHGFDVDAQSIDLRTIEYVNPGFPRLGGFVSGVARLDSSWLDVRFSNADIVHQDGPGEPSRFTGNGRITYGEKYLTYDMALDLKPLSLTMLARSYPKLGLGGLVSGPLRIAGTTPDLEIETSLQGAAGAFSYSGRIDADSIGGFGAHGRGQFSAFNPAALVVGSKLPAAVLSGHYDVDMTGENLATLHGTVGLDVERGAVDSTRNALSMFDSVRVYPSHARLQFGDGRMAIIDTLRVRTTAGTAFAWGGLGLPNGRADSLGFRIAIDSLGGLRRYLGSTDTSTVVGATVAAPDSLAGSMTLAGIARGTLDTLSLTGELGGSDLFVNNDRADSVFLKFDLRNVTTEPAGALDLRLDGVRVAGILLDTISGRLLASDATHSRFTMGAQSHNGPIISAAGLWAKDGATTDLTVDTAGVKIGSSEWRLTAPAHLYLDTASVRLDSAVLKNRDSSVIALSGMVPDSGTVSARLVARALPLRDLGVFAQLTDSIAGVANLGLTLSGTRASPRLVANASLTGLSRNDITIDRASANLDMGDRRALVDASVLRDGRSIVAVNGSLPVDFRLFGVKLREDSLRGELRMDTTDLALVQLASKNLKGVAGKLSARINVSGTPRNVVVYDTIRIDGGSARLPQAGIQVVGVRGEIKGKAGTSGQDSTSVHLEAANATGKNLFPGNMVLDGRTTGIIAYLTQRNAPSPTLDFSLGADNFHAINRRSLADLYFTARRGVGDTIRLRGTLDDPVLTGAAIIDHSAIFIPDPDLARKQTVEQFLDVGRTEEVHGLAGLSRLMTNLRTQNVTVTLGNDVRLRSKEADVRLVGSLNIVPSTDQSTRRLGNELVPRLAPEGILTTAGGTYNLNFVVVQREFQVTPGGTVTFAGDPANPTLAISAKYNVKQYKDRPIGVIVNIHGPLLPYPTIDFSSDVTEYTISESDLLSYLLIGKPGFDFSNAAPGSVIAPTLSAIASDNLRSRLGGAFDAFRFELGSSERAATETQASSNNYRTYLYSATIGAEKQFSDKLFLNVNTGLCPFDPTYSPTNSGAFGGLAGSLGAKAEWRFRPDLSAQVAYDPPSYARSCADQRANTGVVNTPGQFSFSFSHTWRF